jgi:hypothetical protein
MQPDITIKQLAVSFNFKVIHIISIDDIVRQTNGLMTFGEKHVIERKNFSRSII